jgi:hypothetical protein
VGLPVSESPTQTKEKIMKYKSYTVPEKLEYFQAKELEAYARLLRIRDRISELKYLIENKYQSWDSDLERDLERARNRDRDRGEG